MPIYCQPSSNNDSSSSVLVQAAAKNADMTLTPESNKNITCFPTTSLRTTFVSLVRLFLQIQVLQGRLSFDFLSPRRHHDVLGGFASKQPPRCRYGLLCFRYFFSISLPIHNSGSLFSFQQKMWYTNQFSMLIVALSKPLSLRPIYLGNGSPFW